MKNLSIILACILVTMISCTKSKEVHPEIGDGNDEIMTVGMKDVHVKYLRTDHAELSRVVFHYSLADVQEFDAAEMTKRDDFFELTLNDLLSDTLYGYYYEVFPNGGDAYNTASKTFHTQAFVAPEPPTPPSGSPEGAINGLFTINANGDQVYFSQGNLQYQASTNTWRFAEKQWDYVGDGTYGTVYENEVKCNNELISPNYDGWIDLFGWGTSGWNNGNTYYHPWDYPNIGLGELYGPPMSSDLTGVYANADWGYYNAISNGGNQANLWRTLTKEEWKYILKNRSTSSNVKYTKAQVNGINGIIIFPDDWETNTYGFNGVNENLSQFSDNVLNANDWETIENNGAVFLSASGFRENVQISNLGLACYYWSVSSCDNDNSAYNICIWDDLVDFWDASCRYYGLHVRLVQDATP